MKKTDRMLLVLQELQRAFDRKLSANDYLDQKLQNILDYSSIIVAIVSAIITSALLNKLGILYWIGLVCVFVAYIITFFVIKQGLSTAVHTNPIGTDLDDLRAQCVNAKDVEALDTLIRAHLSVMDNEGGINYRKDRALMRASNLLFAMVLLLFGSVVLGLSFPALRLTDVAKPFIDIATGLRGLAK